MQEEEEKKLKEEQEKLEHEEYLKLKESFSVEGEGSGEQALQEEVAITLEFVQFVYTSHQKFNSASQFLSFCEPNTIVNGINLLPTSKRLLNLIKNDAF